MRVRSPRFLALRRSDFFPFVRVPRMRDKGYTRRLPPESMAPRAKKNITTHYYVLELSIP